MSQRRFAPGEGSVLDYGARRLGAENKLTIPRSFLRDFGWSTDDPVVLVLSPDRTELRLHRLADHDAGGAYLPFLRMDPLGRIQVPSQVARLMGASRGDYFDAEARIVRSGAAVLVLRLRRFSRGTAPARAAP